MVHRPAAPVPGNPTATGAWRRSVVTGGAGFLGSHLCEALIEGRTQVVCVDNFCTGSTRNVEQLHTRPGFELVEADVSRPFSVPGFVDVVFHLASPASPADYLRLPLETLATGAAGTRNALDLAFDKQARMVLASTSEVYGDPLEHPQSERYWGNVNPVGPRSVYDEAKRYAEALVTADRAVRGTNAAICRIFNTCGPRMRPFDGRAVPTFIRQALAGLPLTVAGDGAQTRSLAYVDDTVRGLLALAASDLTGPVNIGNPREFSILEVARMVIACCDSSSTTRFVDRPVDDPAVRCPDIRLAIDKLQWEPRVSTEEGLRRTVEWFASHPEA
jgi:dTDP-glucose 4,6-dehydratase